MYCVKCKKTTDTSNEQLTTTKNNRRMKRGIHVQSVEQLKHSLLNLQKVVPF